MAVVEGRDIEEMSSKVEQILVLRFNYSFGKAQGGSDLYIGE